MKDCPACGRPAVLRATRIHVNRRQGVSHYITHADGSLACGGPSLAWDCVALKPYPKVRALNEYAKLIERWESWDGSITPVAPC